MFVPFLEPGYLLRMCFTKAFLFLRQACLLQWESRRRGHLISALPLCWHPPSITLASWFTFSHEAHDHFLYRRLFLTDFDHPSSNSILEQLAHPILDSLKNTDNAWLIDLLYAFNSGFTVDAFDCSINIICRVSGNIVKFESMEASWTAEPDLAANSAALRQKLSLLTVMEMVFQSGAHNTGLSFADIAATVQLPVDAVRRLLLFSLSVSMSTMVMYVCF